jgi:hypothetical protein
MEPIHIEFQYAPTDLPEAMKAVRVRLRKNALKFRRGLIGWIVFVVLAIVLFSFLNRHQSTSSVAPPPPPPSSNSTIGDVILPLLPWALIFCSVWFVVFRGLRARSTKMSGVFLEKSQSMVADDSGVIWTEPMTRTEYRWEAFYGFDETPNLFLLYTSDAKGTDFLRFHVVPKRSFPVPMLCDQFRQLLTDRVHSHNRAFQVLPPKPVEADVSGNDAIV